MAEGADSDEKTEDPTSRRLQEAHDKGNVASSKEIVNWVSLFGVGMFVLFMAGGVVSRLHETLSIFISSPHELIAHGKSLQILLFQVSKDVFSIVALPIFFFMFLGIAATVAQTGWVFTSEQMKMNVSKLSPLSGLKRLLGSQAIANFLKSLAKLVLVGVAAGIITYQAIEEAPSFVGEDVTVWIIYIKFMILKILAAVLGVMFFVAIADFMYIKYQHFEKLKMTKQEVKDERKQADGDPAIKAKLRELRIKKSRERMMKRVPEADVIITNPTHYAIALMYKQDTMDAPILVAKGVDFIAEKIREVAKENNIPFVENPPLARALYASVELEQEIPEDHYKAVAEVISYIFSLRKK